ncbi:Pyridoxal-5'-phosphate-dependent protein beta subunit [Paraburkholderia piptadeniae]|uniref:Pyridoxal-phosphate dependent enzyme n=2 Tax=Paraburkholderia TaxID=1822464 RepID=A0A7X1NB49_9BURK|nr:MULTISPECIES: pyridoxal-phosphate dependent enzyme [Paraburkholderia]MPW18722.1 pyridoxal-phosphate dependent enzyme [Paraburkholderia franconis]SIT48327.1 Pyridoxal-5'-phosphate-dependent protein beta subunit [Paraburkholderia piptadeniae]
MFSRTLMRKLEDFENPRIVELNSDLYGASFFLMKLLPARFMLERAVEEGFLRPGGTICESSSGSFGLALAMLAARHGYKLVLVSDWTLDRHLRRRLVQLGVRLDIVDKPARSGGLQQARLNRLAQHLKEMPGSFWPSQYSNLANPLAYGKFAELLIERLGEIDCLVGPVGSGGSMCGTTRVLRASFPELHAIGVDTPNSVLFGQPSGKLVRLAGLGGEIVPSNVDHREFDEIHWLTPVEAFHSTHQLHRNRGLFMGPASGAAYRVANWWSSKHPRKKVVAIFPDEGHRYGETVYDDAWLKSFAGWPDAVRREPVAVETPTESLKGWSCYTWGRRTLEQVLSSLLAPVSTSLIETRLQPLTQHPVEPSPKQRTEPGESSKGDVSPTLIALSHSDGALVSHLELDHDQAQFVDPLYVVFSELRNSSNPNLEHPFSVAIRDEIVGFFVLREKAALPEWAPPDAITLHSLRIARSRQGNGYGKAALHLAKQWVKSNRLSVNRLMLGVNTRNRKARRLYKQTNFLETGASYCGPHGMQDILECEIDSRN